MPEIFKRRNIIVRSVTPTIEGVLLVAITVIISLISVYIPLFGTFVGFFCAVPLAVLTVRQGAGKGCTALVVSFILLAMLISPIISLRLVLTSGVCGVALGWCVLKNFDAVKIFLATLIVASAGQVLSFIAVLALVDVNFLETQMEFIRESFNESFSTYESMGVDKAQIAEAKSQLELGLQTMMVLMPTMIMLSALIETLAAWFTSKWIFPKLQINLPTFPPFAEWRLPELFLYMAAFGAIGLYWGFTRSWTEIYEVSFNLVVVSMLLGLVQGFSLMSFVFDRYKVSKMLRWLFYALMLLNIFFAELLAITGLVDMLLDYRKRLFKD